jgi:hypothetical protein
VVTRRCLSGFKLADQPLQPLAASAQPADHHRVRARYAVVGGEEVKPPPHGVSAVHHPHLVAGQHGEGPVITPRSWSLTAASTPKFADLTLPRSGCYSSTAEVPAGKPNACRAWLIGSGAVGGSVLNIHRAARDEKFWWTHAGS